MFNIYKIKFIENIWSKLGLEGLPNFKNHKRYWNIVLDMANPISITNREMAGGYEILGWERRILFPNGKGKHVISSYI